MSGLRPIRQNLDWGRTAPLRLRAKQVAEGVYAGMHRSARRGAGVEFGGYREYVAGDDLRWLDRRSLLRHGRLVIRQFETETDRTLSILLDATASMSFRGPDAPGSKIDFAALVAAALCRIALVGGDPASLTFLGGERATPVARSSSREQFDRVIAALEGAKPGGDAFVDTGMVDRALQGVARSSRRGAVVVVLSDLLDLPDVAADRIGAMAAAGRVVVVVQILDPAEADFSFSGSVRLRALEGSTVVETDADAARAGYLENLASLSAGWKDAIVRRGGRFVPARTTDDPVEVVRAVVQGIR